MITPVTKVDQDKLADMVGADDHARKLVGLKAARDLKRFLLLTERPLAVKETTAAVLGALLVMAVLVALGVASGVALLSK